MTVVERPPRRERQRGGGVALGCAFVNNMPDSAFRATERQFLRLVEVGNETGNQGRPIQVSRYRLRGAPRTAELAGEIEHTYAWLDELWATSPSFVVVTGAEPGACGLRDEPYWGELAALLDWSATRPCTVVLSCLAAHAALLAVDGMERVRLPAKRSGMFWHRVEQDHPLARGLGGHLAAPHSRLNEVRLDQLLDSGYAVLAASAEAGWCVATRQHGAAQLVLMQGHPEYDPSSLVREYRRDLTRYLAGITENAPALPARCVSTRDEAELTHFHEQLCDARDRQSARELAQPDFDAMGRRAPWPWRPAATRLYANLLRDAAERAAVR